MWPALENLSGRKPRGRCLWGKSAMGWVLKLLRMRCSLDRRWLFRRLASAVAPELAGFAVGLHLCTPSQIAAYKKFWPVWLSQPVRNMQYDQVFCHAACFLCGARDRGTWPRLNVSMISIVPPQQGHGSCKVSGAGSSSDDGSCSGALAPIRARTFAILALRCAEASRP